MNTLASTNTSALIGFLLGAQGRLVLLAHEGAVVELLARVRAAVFLRIDSDVAGEKATHRALILLVMAKPLAQHLADIARQAHVRLGRLGARLLQRAFVHGNRYVLEFVSHKYTRSV